MEGEAVRASEHQDAQAAHARYVTVGLAATLTGLSAGAIRKRIERGIWLEGRQFRRARDGRIWIDTKGVQEWIETA